MMLSLIIPVHNGERELERCLQAIRDSSRHPDELIVVDDASTDASAEVAQRWGARVIREPHGPRGPARARNDGAQVAQGEILLFVDADVAVHPDTIARLEARLRDDPTLAAVFGSYDDAPTDPGLVSQYKNLQHHWVHQHARPEAQTFWAGCGAVRREAFEAVGGFDTRFASATIEDIEFGLRLHDAGWRILLDADIRCTHLKRWTLARMLRADISGRAIPWSRLIAARGQAPLDLNLDRSARWSGALAWFAVVCCCLAWWWPWLLLLAMLAVAAIIWLNRAFYRFLWQRGGWPLLLVGMALHLAYYLYSTAIFAWFALPKLLWRRVRCAKKA